MKHNKQNGIAKIFTLITMVLLVAVLGLAMNETQKVQENRSKAAGLSSLPVTPPIALGDRVLNEGKYIDLSLYLEELSSISDKNLNLWLGRLNLAYEDYSELTNWKPHDGNKITIQSVECGDNCPGWAWADSSPVISWAKQWWLIDELKRIDNKDDWSFGILHEISHKFDNYESWGGFDNEMMANFKMAYVLEKRNAKVCPNNDEQYFVGANIIEVYKNNKDYGYDAIIKKYRSGKTEELKQSIGNFLLYKFLLIKDEIGGWDTYKQVFRNLGSEELNSENTKINAFLDEMTIISKKDVRKMFNQEERAILEIKFGKVFSTNGKCGLIKDKCDVGIYKDAPDTSIYYVWQCLGNNGGKNVKCSIKSPATYAIPATGIKVNPTSLSLRVGQTAKISYVLTPKDTTNPVYSSIVGSAGLVRIAKTSPPCPNEANCAPATPGIQYYNVTALKSGSVKIYFRTSSGKSASSTILINK